MLLFYGSNLFIICGGYNLKDIFLFCKQKFSECSFVMEKEERLQRIKAGAFLATVAGISAIVGFSATLSAAKKADPKYFNKGLQSSAELADNGAILALRALGWGSLYAIAGTSCLCYGIWKLSGAKDLKDFRIKMGNLLPVLPKNNPPQSRTEFSGLNDLMTYLAEDYGKKN